MKKFREHQNLAPIPAFEATGHKNLS